MGAKRNHEPRARATVICLRSGKVLMVRKKSGRWNFPGGTIEPDETPIQAAAREFKEETDIHCDGLLELCAVEAGSILHHVFTTQYDDRAKPIASNEIAACKWVLRADLNSTSLTTSAAALLSMALPALVEQT
ncbi:NUDIX hydrolase [Pseudomonas putida]